MNNLRDIWAGMTMQRRMIVLGATVLMFGAIVLLARGAGQQDMSLLFGNLDGPAAGDVVNALEQQGTIYEVRGNAIYVPAAQRDLVRMNLAGQGLPASGSRGYELLDELSGFSTTAQMFDAAYWRAKEGELARTIAASPQVRAARVHISNPEQRPFARDQKQSAAVTVTTNGRLAPDHVRALQVLVASAVPRLVPADVAVIDDAGSLLSEAETENGTASTDARAEALRARAQRLLAARVGTGNAVVEVTIDATTQTEQITERMIDPDSRIAISTEVTESNGTSSDDRGGQVTVASNLPDGDAGQAGGSTSSENSESRTLTNYEISQTERQLVRGPGEIRRLTVAVLVNDAQIVGQDGSVTTTERTDAELAALRELVASAVGLDETRGDVLTLKSMPFEPATPQGTATIAGANGLTMDVTRLAQIGALALVAIVLGVFVLRPLLREQAAAASISPQDRDDPQDFAPAMAMAMDGSGMDDLMTGDFGNMAVDQGNAAARLRQMIADRQPETLQVLEDWIADAGQERKAS